jgi:hypothetical protein
VSLEELERRCALLEDLEQLKTLHRQYIEYLDNCQFKEILELFTDNATAEVRRKGVRKGKAGLEELYIKDLGRRTKTGGHFVTQPLLSVEGNKAIGHWTVLMLMNDPVRWIEGKNDCEYVKENGKWKICKLKFTRVAASEPSLFP